MKISLLPAVGKGQGLSFLSNPKFWFLMRVSFILWVSMAISLQLAAFDSVGQSIDQIEVTLEFKNARLSEVLTRIQNDTKINFIYTPDQVDAITNISLERQRRTVKNLLEAVLTNTSLTFKEVDGTVVLFKKKQSTTEGHGNTETAEAVAPEITVTGKVTDVKTGEPLPAVNVVVKGGEGSYGTSTDKNGVYSLSVQDENSTLVFSFIGFKTYEIAVNGRSRIDVALESDLQELREVVINAGYYDVTDKEKTGSISKVTSKVIEKQPVNNPLLSLQGRVPGLSIEQTSGLPGSAMKVSIRGKNSLQNGVDPLYIVDGVPFSSQHIGGDNSSGIYNGFGVSPFYSLSPTDIESVEILKDADATAIYGSRGANGVILITTKRGKSGKAKINLNFSSGISKVPHFLDLMNTKEYLQMRNEALRNDNRSMPITHYDINGTWDTTRYTNWQKEFLGGTARNTIAQASISGGSQTTSYLFSGSYQKETVVFPGTKSAQKGAFLISISNESPNEKFKSRFSTNYVINSSDLNGFDLTSYAMTLAPDAPKLYNEDGSLNWENSTWTNPLAFSKYRRFELSSYNLISNAFLGYEILKGLEVKSNFGLNHLRRDERMVFPSTAFDPALNMPPSSSEVYKTDGSNQTWIIEPQISWTSNEKTFGKFSTVLGATFQNQSTLRQSYRFSGFLSNSLIDDLGSATEVNNGGSTNSIYRYAAIYARINYSFHDRYIINLTGRRDGSSRFGPGKQFANLGAIGAAWIFTNEGFGKNLPFLNFGKLRSSFGVTGNDQIGDYQYLDTYRSYVLYNGSGGLVPTRLFNPNYAWETTRKFEVAIELGFLNDRINLAGAYYNNRSSNQLIDYRVGSTTGFTGVLKNFPAKIENSGVEIELNTTNTLGEFKWTTNLNVSLPRNKLIEFKGLDASSYASTYVEGKSLSIRKVYNYTGIDPTTGIYTFEDMNGDGQITPADKLVVRELKTNFFGGLNNSLSYKGWTLDVFFQFVNKKGQSVYTAFGVPGRLFNNQPTSIINKAWTGEGDNAEFQRYTTNNSDVVVANQRYLESQKGIVDASFLRLKNVSLSYKFPTKWTAGIESSLFVQGQNLFTLTGYDGLDPETGAGVVLPTLRTIVLGVNISL